MNLTELVRITSSNFLPILIVGLLLSACSSASQPTTQPLSFDQRYAFDIFTQFPADEPFPFQPGERIRINVFLVTHPMQEWVQQELAPDAVWYGSVYPLGQPDPADPFMETMLLEIAAAERPTEVWQLPWRIDLGSSLTAVIEANTAPGPLAVAEVGAQIPAVMLMEIFALESLETLPDSGEQVWRLQLKPVGEVRNNLVVSDVEILLPK